jgi:hypothetical protein
LAVNEADVTVTSQQLKIVNPSGVTDGAHLNVGGGITVGNGATINGSANFTGAVTVQGKDNAGQGLAVTHALSANSITIGSGASVIAGNTTIKGTLTVEGGDTNKKIEMVSNGFTTIRGYSGILLNGENSSDTYRKRSVFIS